MRNIKLALHELHEALTRHAFQHVEDSLHRFMHEV